ncbi:hypothetical protein RM549_15400 [Salegentibacter sp. F188]|uniref:Allorecognition 2 n=1 Tax=Autumnicola patrickiae TaxID=3075591 RepID=A0ABU3E5H7_9FLAO|nr:hypothetical protein [Salegentibacter sp. F188]MDT0691180.1 hypothetical protein [Salegentibacter sp. F188]
MKKKITCFYICLASFILSSCSGDNLYDFQDLSRHDDYIIEVEVNLKDPEADFSFRTVTFETNGYNKLLREGWAFNSSTTGPASPNTYFHRVAVKAYKTTGIEFFPGENIKEVTIQIYDLVNYYPIVKYTSSSPEAVSVFYNFETGEETINSL